MTRNILLGVLVCTLVAADNAPPKVAVTQFDVPYRLAPTQHILVRAKINGNGPYNLVLDTGAPLLILAKKVESSLGVKSDANGWATLDRFEVEGGAVIEKLTARFDELYQLESMNGLGLAGTEIHGLMGYSVLARYRIDIDFSNPKLIWTKLDYKPEEPARAGKAFIPGGLNMLGGMMKSFGKLLGMDRLPVPTFRPFLGLTVNERDGKLLVESVLPDSAVAAASEPLRPGDEITHVNDVATKTIASFQKAQAKLRVGETTNIRSMRDGRELRHEVKPSGGF